MDEELKAIQILESSSDLPGRGEFPGLAEAISTLSNYKSDKAIQALIRALNKRELGGLAAKALVEIGDSRALEPIRQQIPNVYDFADARFMIKAYKSFEEPKEYTLQLINWLVSENNLFLRMAISSALDEISEVPIQHVIDSLFRLEASVSTLEARSALMKLAERVQEHSIPMIIEKFADVLFWTRYIVTSFSDSESFTKVVEAFLADNRDHYGKSTAAKLLMGWYKEEYHR